MLWCNRIAGLSALVALSLAGGAASGAPDLAPVEDLVPHRAVYDLTLTEARETAGVRGVSGRLVYEFTRRECREFVLSYRQVMTMETGEGPGGEIDFNSTTTEDDAGTVFRFSSTSIVNNQDETRVDGTARRAADREITVELTRPDPGTTELDAAALFPTEHMRRILAAAARGEAMVQADVFDGSGTGDEVSPSFAAIGARHEGEEGLEAPSIKAGLAGMARWPVTISYFPEQEDSSGEQTPKFTFGAEVFKNGVSRALRLDYGKYALAGRLVALDLFPRDECAKP